MLLRAAAENVEAALDSFADRMVQEEEQECHQTGLGEAAADADDANGNDTDDSGGETDDDIDGEPTAAQLEAEQAEAAQEAAEAAAEAEDAANAVAAALAAMAAAEEEAETARQEIEQADAVVKVAQQPDPGAGTKMTKMHYESSTGVQEEVSVAGLPALIADGTVGVETVVWIEGLPDWMALGHAQQHGGGRVLREAIKQAPIRTQELYVRQVWSGVDGGDSGSPLCFGSDALLRVLLQMGFERAEIAIEFVLEQIDTDGDGQVSLKEFTSWFFQPVKNTRDSL